MTDEMKLKLFETVLKMERTIENSDEDMYKCNGAIAIVKALGLVEEYINWSYNK